MPTSTSAPPTISDARRRRLLLGSYLGMISLATELNTIPVCLIAISGTFAGLSDTAKGAIATAGFIGAVTGILAAGPLADRYGMRRFLLCGAALETIGLIAIGLAPTYPTLLLACILGGLGTGTLDALLSPLICALAPERKASALNLLHAFYSIGAVLTVLLASWLLAAGVGWRLIFPAMALPGLLAGAIYLTTPIPAAHSDGVRRPARWLLRQPLMLLILFSMVLLGGSEIGAAQWIPAFMQKIHGWSGGRAGVVFLGFSLGMAGGRVGASRLSRLTSPMALLAATTALFLGCLLVADLSRGAWVAAVGFALLGVAVACIWPTMLSYAAERFPQGGATMFSLLAGLGNLGGVLGPVGVGFISDRMGLRRGLGSLAILPVLLLSIFIVRLARDRADGDRSRSGPPSAAAGSG